MPSSRSCSLGLGLALSSAAAVIADFVGARYAESNRRTQASVEENTAVPVSAANTYGHSVIAILAAVAGVLILA